MNLVCDHSADCSCHGLAPREDRRNWFDRPRGEVDPCPFPLTWNTEQRELVNA